MGNLIENMIIWVAKPIFLIVPSPAGSTERIKMEVSNAFCMKGFSVVGFTTDSQPVMSFYQITNTYGLPLEVVLDEFKKEGIVPDWTGFFREAVELGRNPDRVQLEMEMAVREVYGLEYFKNFKYKLTKWRQLIFHK